MTVPLACSRVPLSGAHMSVYITIRLRIVACMQAMVDVISSQGWWHAATAAMELSQMVTQGQWDRDPVLLQLPHVSKDLAKTCEQAGCEDVFSLIELKVHLSPVARPYCTVVSLILCLSLPYRCTA